MVGALTPFNKAAKHFGVRPETIGDVVRRREIAYETYGMVKALDRAAMKELASVFSPPRQRRALSA